MKLITMLENRLEQTTPPPDLYAYTHASEKMQAALHGASVGMGPFVNVEHLLLTGMVFMLDAIRIAGELPEDLNDIPLEGEGQAAHDAVADKLLASLPCPDCGSAPHPDACNEPDILNPNG